MSDLPDDPKERAARDRANRENALKSCGPKTARGKAVVARNALKHGLLSSRIVVGWAEFESQQDFDILRTDLRDDLEPEGALEDLLVEKIAVGFWRLQRMWAFESSRITETARARALEELRRVRASAKAEDATASGQTEQWARYYTAATDALRRAMAKLVSGEEAPDDPELRIRGALQELAAAPIAPFDTGISGTTTASTPLAGGPRAYRWFHDILTALDLERGELANGETRAALSDIAEQMRERLNDDELLLQAWESSRRSVQERTLASQDPSDQARTLFRRYLVPPSPQLDVYVRYETSVERRLERDMGNLLVLQSVRRGTPSPPQLRAARR